MILQTNYLRKSALLGFYSGRRLPSCTTGGTHSHRVEKGKRPFHAILNLFDSSSRQRLNVPLRFSNASAPKV